jgi:Leucine-rich repeat (LRR) protein
MLNVPEGYPDPDIPLHIFLTQKDPDWHLHQYQYFTTCAEVSEIPSSECEALVALYNSTGGPAWEDNTNWLVTDLPSGWYGVNVESGHVTSLYLSYNQLSGTIPPELESLSFLSWLDLANNQLNGSIPPELGNLSSLNILSLDNNQLNGSIPPELGNLSSLEYLYLTSNQLSGSIPPELGSLSILSDLRLTNNGLSGGIPPQLGNLSSLSILHLDGNQERIIPVEMGKLSSLTWLLLS